MNPFPQPAWADSDHYEETYLMVQPNEALGILVVQEESDPEPLIIMCSLFNDPDRVFYEGRDMRAAGMTFQQARMLLDQLEEKFRSLPPTFTRK